MNLPEIKIAHVKTVANFIVSRSVGYAATSVVINNTTQTNRRQKAQAVIGAAVIGDMVADHTEGYVNEKIDSITKHINNITKHINNIKSEFAAAQAQQ